MNKESPVSDLEAAARALIDADLDLIMAANRRHDAEARFADLLGHRDLVPPVLVGDHLIGMPAGGDDLDGCEDGETPGALVVVRRYVITPVRTLAGLG